MTLSQPAGNEEKIIESSFENHEKIMSHLKVAAKYLMEAQETVHFDGPYKRVSDEVHLQPPLKQQGY